MNVDTLDMMLLTLCSLLVNKDTSQNTNDPESQNDLQNKTFIQFKWTQKPDTKFLWTKKKYDNLLTHNNQRQQW